MIDADLDDEFLSADVRVKELAIPQLIKVQGSTAFFETPSATGRGVYIQKIKFMDLKSYLSNKHLRPRQAVQYAIHEGDLHLTCNCPAFKFWGFQYIATKGEFAFGRKELRKPKIRNPKLRGSVCKHLYRILLRWASYKRDLTANILY